jgi:hypothetical protein
MFLETARLWLERSAEGDTVGFMGLRRDETVQRFLGGVVTAWVAEIRFEWVLSYWEEHDHGMCLTREKTKGRRGCEVSTTWRAKYSSRTSSGPRSGPGAMPPKPRLRSCATASRGWASTGSWGSDAGDEPRFPRVLRKLGFRRERGATMWGSPQRLYALERLVWWQSTLSRGARAPRHGADVLRLRLGGSLTNR